MRVTALRRPTASVSALLRSRCAAPRGPSALLRRAITGPAQDWSDTATYTRTRRPVEEATTLPGAVYHDEAFYELEKTHVWRSSWVAAAELSELSQPGDLLPATVGGERIILANDNGTIRAFHNVCRHRGAQLVSEKCTKRRTILCPYHRWGYALECVAAAPATRTPAASVPCRVVARAPPPPCDRLHATASRATRASARVAAAGSWARRRGTATSRARLCPRSCAASSPRTSRNLTRRTWVCTRCAPTRRSASSSST